MKIYFSNADIFCSHSRTSIILTFDRRVLFIALIPFIDQTHFKLDEYMNTNDVELCVSTCHSIPEKTMRSSVDTVYSIMEIDLLEKELGNPYSGYPEL